jgi:methanogenic corrinoid protein MtbC1
MDLMTVVDDALSAYLAEIERGNRLAAVGVVTEALHDGVPAEILIERVIARGQAAVGQGWLDGRWSVAMEHRASGIAESALSAVAETAMRTPGAPREGSAGRAVVACSEGEWHSLPGRMATEVLRLRGIDVTFVGPSVPAGDLAAMIGDDPPPVVAVTCSMPLSLAGTWRTLTAVRELGTFVVCGGRGFGADGHWGLTLGADAWAPGLIAGADLVVTALERSRPEPRGAAGAPESIDELSLLQARQSRLVDGSLALALDFRPELQESDAAVRQMRDDLAGNLKALSAAVIVSDAGLLIEHVQWLEELVSSRGLPLRFVPTALGFLRQVLPDDLPLAGAILDEAIGACQQAPAASLAEFLG